jgi:hypothetical protein
MEKLSLSFCSVRTHVRSTGLLCSVKCTRRVFLKKVQISTVNCVVAKKRTRKAVKHQRGVVGATLEKIQEQRTSDKKAARDAAIKKAKDAKKKAEAVKKTTQAQAPKQKATQNVAKKGPSKGQASSKR